MYELAPNASALNTTFCGELLATPRDLVKRFGPPRPPSGDRKISGSYVFSDESGNVAVLYDWKSTSLYDGRPESSLPSVESFWASDEQELFCLAVRGKVNVPAFAKWLGARVK
ncbi:hypothetical protein [Dyella sp. AtDHG13]|uniref:hypothetical protein n=1 Tax=Dyella sp. AtDHG13 TaxID=1938897 RepID=UPI0011B3C27E|nr:hypothetical protein [Dyella sp. AtDHG13]